ncbi:hypothetical protein [Telluria beijingensis]|uniref:hypothetical protein n=1 Tax=Telluria beijingensis TaxID=3068633 RepID=UPI00279550AB|nr:hypothetical protein [Massilia sp. REN29]
MAGHPSYRKKFQTDPALLKLASMAPLHPKKDRAVFYADDFGARLASLFVKQNPEYTRLDELLSQTKAGCDLWSALKGGDWSHTEEVWWELSWRLARIAEGTVNVFGPTRFVRNEPISSFRHRYSTGSFANSVFEKVELPELEANPRVTQILYNGKPFGE